jgi:hypothetical protein
MDRNPNSSHFHILWDDRQHLDWECFDTRLEAEARALEIALPGEVFRIEEVFANCPLRGAKFGSSS